MIQPECEKSSPPTKRPLISKQNELYFQLKWLELKAKLQEDASFYRNKMEEFRGQYSRRSYAQGHHDYAADILKWMVEEEKGEGGATSEGVKE